MTFRTYYMLVSHRMSEGELENPMLTTSSFNGRERERERKKRKRESEREREW